MYLRSYTAPDFPSEDSIWGFPHCDDVQPERLVGGHYTVYFPCYSDLISLIKQWWDVPMSKDVVISGVLCDWLQDHRDLLLSGAVGPNPAERLEQIIDWFRQHFERGGYARTE
jgi:hypothetical protein